MFNITLKFILFIDIGRNSVNFVKNIIMCFNFNFQYEGDSKVILILKMNKRCSLR